MIINEKYIMDVDDEDDDISVEIPRASITKQASDFDYRFVLQLVYADDLETIDDYIEKGCIHIGETIYDIFDNNMSITDFKIVFMFDFLPNCDVCKNVGDIFVMYPSNKTVWTVQPYVTIDFDANYKNSTQVFKLVNLLSSRVDCGQHDYVYAQNINCANRHTEQHITQTRVSLTKDRKYDDDTTTKRCAVPNITKILLPENKHIIQEWRRYCKFDNKDNMVSRRTSGYGRGKHRITKRLQFKPTTEYLEDVKKFGNVNYAFDDIVVIFDFINSNTKEVVDQQKNNNIDRTFAAMKSIVDEKNLTAYRDIYILKKNDTIRYVSCIITFDDTFEYNNKECDIVISYHLNFEKYLRNGNYDMCSRFLSLINVDDTEGFIDLLEHNGLSFLSYNKVKLKEYIKNDDNQ